LLCKPRALNKNSFFGQQGASVIKLFFFVTNERTK
jgi:hypothetical protein